MNYLIKYTSFLAALILLASCAQQLTPSGGKRDTTPPQIVKSQPLNGSVNFTGKKIGISFNEFIQLKDLNSQLIVSPPVKKQPEIEATGKKLKIFFDEELTPNTTYTIFMGDAISDITEQNSIKGFSFIFSTGPVIDSLVLKGNILAADDNKPQAGVFVMLYNSRGDSIPSKELPRYIGKTNKDGVFSITNIAPGKYSVFALNDQNNNYLFDQPSEKIAFRSELLELIPDTSKKNITSIDLHLFEEAPEKQFVKKVSNLAGRIELQFNKPAINLSYKILNNPTLKFDLEERSFLNDTLILWHSPGFADSVNLLIQADDFSDTIELALKNWVTQKTMNKGRGDDDKLVISATPATAGKIGLHQKYTLAFNYPLLKITGVKVSLISDKDTIEAQFAFVNGNKRKLELTNQLKEKTNYQLFIPPAKFSDIFSHNNDTIKFSFSTLSGKEYGSIKLKVNSKKNSAYIVQLQDSKFAPIATYYFALSTNNEIIIPNLLPETYNLKIIEDTDANKYWTSGKFYKSEQPENILHLTKGIIVKKNFETEQEIIFE